MFLQRLGMTAFFAAFAALPLQASMVSFMVIETGLLPDTGGNEYSSLWEDGLMGTFFDEGHIVSNTPILRLEKTPAAELPGEAQGDFTEAFRGGADYFILAVLEYINQDGKTRPRLISIRIFAAGAPSNIYEQQFPAGTGINLSDEYTLAKEAAKIIASHIKDE